MEKKKTNELLESIKTKREILDYINQNKDELIAESLSEYLNRLLAESAEIEEAAFSRVMDVVRP